MYVSVTEVQTYKRCRRQWDYSSFNRQGLSPIMQPKPYLDLGTMVHKTLAYWIQKPTLDGISLQEVFLTIASQHRATVVSNYTRATNTHPSEMDMEPLLDAITLGASMMRNYQQYYKEPLPPHLQFCSPEQEVLIPIPNTEHLHAECGAKGCTQCNDGMTQHYLKARLDALAQDTMGNLYVVENKTYDKRPDINLLEVSDQFIGYVWCAQQLAKHMPNNPPVIGIAYNGLWKRAAPPQRPKKLELSDLFVRCIITPAQDEVDEYGRELTNTVMEMANTPYIYKNRVWQGCWDCSYEQLCRTQSQAGDVDYVLRTQYTKRVEEDTADIVRAVDEQPLIQLTIPTSTH